MGAWETGNFGNDDAMDFIAEVNEGGKKQILNAITKITEASPDQYLEAPDCAIALAAIEYVAAAKGKPAEDFPEEAADWLLKNSLLPFANGGLFGIGAKKIDIGLLSKQAIDKITSNSELKELWEESEEYDGWIVLVKDLQDRIS